MVSESLKKLQSIGINLNSEEIAALVPMLRLLGIHVLRLKLLADCLT